MRSPQIWPHLPALFVPVAAVFGMRNLIDLATDSVIGAGNSLPSEKEHNA
jgi:hypothetical protein